MNFDEMRGARMDFGNAIRALREGRRIARAGWNGKGMWVVLLPGDPAAPMAVKPCLGMRNAHGEMQPGWNASTADVLAEDWEVLPQRDEAP